MIFNRVAVASLLLIGVCSSQVITFDCKIDIHSPSVGTIYSIDELKSNVTVSFGEGAITEKIKKHHNLFLFCVNWDIWNASNQDHCHKLDEPSNVPFFNGREGIHRFRSSLKYVGPAIGESPIEQLSGKDETVIVAFEEISYFVNSQTQASPLTRNSNQSSPSALKLKQPCSYAGVFPAIVPWTVMHGGDSPKVSLALTGARLDIPLDLRATSSMAWEDIELQVLYPQFLALCTTNAPALAKKNASKFEEDPDVRLESDLLTSKGANWIESGWEPEECAQDLSRQCREWYRTQCSSNEPSRDATYSPLSTPPFFSQSLSPSRHSLAALKNKVKEVVQKGRSVDHNIVGKDVMDDHDGTDGCSSIQNMLFRESQSEKSINQHTNPKVRNETVYIIGNIINNHFAKRQRDFILRDLLGCVNRVHVCVDNDKNKLNAVDMNYVEQECENILAYSKKMKGISSSLFNWTCGECESMGDAVNKEKSSVLISTFSALEEDILRRKEDTNNLESDRYNNQDDENPLYLNSVDFLLKQKWNPQVIIHLNDEVASSLAALSYLYNGAGLALRMYGKRGIKKKMIDGEKESDESFSGTIADDRITYIGECKVITIPIGYLAGFADEVEDTIQNEVVITPRSGTQAVRASHILQRSHLWSFVGSRCSHHPHVADARSAMAAWLPTALSLHVDNSSLDVVCHFTERDGYMSARDTAKIYRRSLFVASPHGESTDCFRHYEAVISGAIPITDVSELDDQWSWYSEPHMNNEETTTPTTLDQSDQSTSMLVSLPYPLGWVFPLSSSSLWVEPLDEKEENTNSYLSNSVQDSLLWTLRSKQIKEWPAFLNDERYVKWKHLSSMISHMGEDEINLRRDLNKEWYISEIQSLRYLIQKALIPSDLKTKHRSGFTGHTSSFEFKNISASDDYGCVMDTEQGTEINGENICLFGEVNDSVELQKAVAKIDTLLLDVRKRHGVSIVRVIIVLLGKYYELDETLVVKGSGLHVTVRGRSSSPPPSFFESYLTSFPQNFNSCVSSQSIIDGKHKVRILSVHSGATLHLDNVAIYRGSCVGDGGGIAVVDKGTFLSGGMVDLKATINGKKEYTIEKDVNQPWRQCIGSISFLNNAAGVYSGGGLYVGIGAKANFQPDVGGHGAMFYDNIANSAGGALQVEGNFSSVTMVSPHFINNSAYRGGALGVNNGGDYFSHSAVFRGNIAYFDGGAVYVNTATACFNGVSFLSNSVSMGGSALHVINQGAMVSLGGLRHFGVEYDKKTCHNLTKNLTSIPPVFSSNEATYGHMISLKLGACLVMTLKRKKMVTLPFDEVKDRNTIIQWKDYEIDGDLRERSKMFSDVYAHRWSLIGRVESELIDELKLEYSDY